jgi:hypothetical protein
MQNLARLDPLHSYHLLQLFRPRRHKLLNVELDSASL